MGVTLHGNGVAPAIRGIEFMSKKKDARWLADWDDSYKRKVGRVPKGIRHEYEQFRLIFLKILGGQI